METVRVTNDVQTTYTPPTNNVCVSYN